MALRRRPRAPLRRRMAGCGGGRRPGQRPTGQRQRGRVHDRDTPSCPWVSALRIAW